MSSELVRGHHESQRGELPKKKFKRFCLVVCSKRGSHQREAIDCEWTGGGTIKDVSGGGGKIRSNQPVAILVARGCGRSRHIMHQVKWSGER